MFTNIKMILLKGRFLFIFLSALGLAFGSVQNAPAESGGVEMIGEEMTDIADMPLEHFGGEIEYISKKDKMPWQQGKEMGADNKSNIQATIAVQGMEFNITPQTRFMDVNEEQIYGNDLLKIGDYVSFSFYNGIIVEIRLENVGREKVVDINDSSEAGKRKYQKIIFEDGVYRN